jgi:hypothetical protein
VKDYKIILPFINVERSLTQKVVVFWAILFVATGVVGAYFNKEIIKAVFLIMGIVAFVTASLLNKYRIVGEIVMTENCIMTNSFASQELYNLQDVGGIQLFLDGIKGDAKFSFNTFSLKQGTDNYIEFTYRGVKKRLFFLLEKSTVPSIRSLIDNWRSNRVEFKLYDKSKVIIKK